MLRLHDTALASVVELVTREPGKVSIYVCGPTVDNVPHVGHGRQVLVYDVLRRYLEWSGIEVTHVSNVTDIDDRIIERAAEEGRDPAEVAVENEAIWWECMDRMGAARPTTVPHATEYVARMIALIEELAELGVAYEASDGIYMDVSKVNGYGLLAQQPLESLRAGARVEVVEGKRSPLDFALWKLSKPGEPVWDSPFGPGRPGWHTECVVMSLDLLGEGFDLHTGGMDLKFPHHENERAQASALGHDFARRWMHHAFVEVGGEKMSKSLGNYTSLRDLLSRTDARAYRLLVLGSHYRSPMEVMPATVQPAEEALERLDALARRFALSSEPPRKGDPEVRARFSELMDGDLDTPAALALIFDLVRSANAAADSGDQETAERLALTVADLAGALGLELRGEEAEVDPEAAELVRRREAARAARDFAAADSIRDQLKELGWTVEDTPGGTQIRR